MIIGITGGIGSGKSLLTDYLAENHGFHAIKTDDLARDMMNTDSSLKDSLKKAFGDRIYNDDGTLNRQIYAGIIHKSREEREKSDSIVHPAVWNRVLTLIAEQKKKGIRNFAVETALPGTGFKEICTEVWHVHTDPAERKNRLIRDRGYSGEYTDSVMKGQIPEECYSDFADRILDNSTDISSLYRQADRLLTALSETR